MEDIKVAKHQLEVCFRNNLGFKEEAPRILRIIKQSSESYIQFFYKTITDVLTSHLVQATPVNKFYALLMLLKASEAKNYSFYHFLVKETDLLNHIYRCAEYDLNPKSVNPHKGTHYFSKTPSPAEMILGYNVVRLCQEIIVDWNHLCKEFKPRKYFEIFKFLLGRIRKTNQLEKPFFFINKHFDLRQDLANCDFQKERPYIIPRQSGRNVLKVPNPAVQAAQNEDDPASDVEECEEDEDEFAEDPDELMFTIAGPHSRKTSQDNGAKSCVLEQLRRESLKGEEDANIEKIRQLTKGLSLNENPDLAQDEEVEVITDELEADQIAEEAVPQTAEEINPTLVDPSNVAIPNKTEGFSRFDSGEATVTLSQQEDNVEEQKGDDMEQDQEKKENVQKQLLVRTQPASPDNKPNMVFLGRGNSGGSRVFGMASSRNNLELDLLKIKNSITKSQTMSRQSSLSGSQLSTPQKKGSMFDFDAVRSQAELDTQSHENVDVPAKSQFAKHSKHKRVQSLQQGTAQPAVFVNAVRAELRTSERRSSWHSQEAPLMTEVSQEGGLVPQVSNMLVHSKGGLTQSIQRGIRASQMPGKTNKIIVFAEQDEPEQNSVMQENQLLKEKLKEYEMMIKMLGGKVENLTMENNQLKKAAP